MQYMLTPYGEGQEPFAWWEGAFNEQQLTWLQEQAKNSEITAGVGGEKNNLTNRFDLRRSKIKWLSNTEETVWVFEILANVVSTLNAQFFRFNLTGFGEPIQLTNYDESNHGTYGWHVDMGPHTNAPCRKLSIVVQLSNPVDYEGGVLELQPVDKNVVKMRKQRGLITVFPSWTLHQVTPVTQGNRQSLVAWISGPAFK